MLDPLSLLSHSRASMEEQIMAIVGKTAKDPELFRKWLQSLADETLTAEYEKVMEETICS